MRSVLALVFLLTVSFSLEAFAETIGCRENSDKLLENILPTEDFYVKAFVKFSPTAGAGRYAVLSRYSSKKNQRGLWLGVDKWAPSLIWSTDGTKMTRIVKGSVLTDVERKGLVILTYAWSAKARTMYFYVNGAARGSATIPAQQLPFFNAKASERIACVERSSTSPDQLFPGDVLWVKGQRRLCSLGEVTQSDAAMLQSKTMSFWTEIPRLDNGTVDYTSLRDAIAPLVPAADSLVILPTRGSLDQYRKASQIEIPAIRRDFGSTLKSLTVALPGYNLMKKTGPLENQPNVLTQAATAIAQEATKPGIPMRLVLDDFMSFKRNPCTGSIHESHLKYENLAKLCNGVRNNANMATLPVDVVLYCGNDGELTGRQADAIRQVNPNANTSNGIDGFLSYLKGIKTSKLTENSPGLRSCITGVQLFVSAEVTGNATQAEAEAKVRSCIDRIRREEPSLRIELGVYVRGQQPGETAPAPSCPGQLPPENDIPELAAPEVATLDWKMDQLNLLHLNPSSSSTLFSALIPWNLTKPGNRGYVTEKSEAQILRNKLLPAFVAFQGDATMMTQHVDALARTTRSALTKADRRQNSKIRRHLLVSEK